MREKVKRENKKIEILAPAGSYESLRAALMAGCDAVYIGGEKFGARAFANNLSSIDLIRAIDEVHIHQKKLYLTVNTLLKQSELEQLYEYLLPFYKEGLDAIIVQDLGVIQFIKEQFPDLTIHASTQMTITGSAGAKFLQKHGVKRIVTARELSLQELKTIREETDLEIESFVHGALCYCYSGQCLMSSLLGGRSGNRGTCAQPCRMLYEYNKKKAYYLSPKDMSALELIPDLIKAGVDSFKIEGRMKQPQYAALTSFLYRKYTDLYLQLGDIGYVDYLQKHASQFLEDKRALMDLYNRGGFSAGYYQSYHGKQMMSLYRPNHSGVLVGMVIECLKNRVKIKLQEELFAQDIVEFRNKKEQTLYEYTIKEGAEKGKQIWANVKADCHIQTGDMVYRIRNQELLSDIEEIYMKKQKKEKITGKICLKKESPVTITLQYLDYIITITGQETKEAKNQALTEEIIEKSFQKIKDTPFEWEYLKIELEKGLFFPSSQLNELRRMAICALENKILKSYQRQERAPICLHAQRQQKQKKKAPVWIASISNMEQYKAVILIPEVSYLYLHLDLFSEQDLWTICIETKNYGKKVYFLLPRILRGKRIKQCLALCQKGAEQYHIAGFVISSIESYALLRELFKEEKQLEWVADSFLYTMNEKAKEMLREKNTRFTIPFELNEKELKKREIEEEELILYGHIPLMISAQCIIENTAKCGQKNGLISSIKDRKNKTFYVMTHCNYCYNTILNGDVLSLLEKRKEVIDLSIPYYRLDFTIENKKQTKEIIEEFLRVYEKQAPPSGIITNYTMGHFKRGVL